MRYQALAGIALALIQRGQPDQANRLLAEAIEGTRTIASHFRRSQALAEIANVLVQGGQPDLANTLLDEMLEVTHLTDDIGFARSMLLARDAQILALVGRHDQAIEVARSVTHGHFRSQALAEVAQALVESGQLDRASPLLDEAIEIARSMTRVDFRSQTLAGVVEVLIHGGRYKELATLYADVIEISRLIADGDVRCQALVDIAEFLIQGGQRNQANTLLDEALGIARLITIDGVRTLALAPLPKALTQAGRPKLGVEVALSITHDTCRSQALVGIAEVLVERAQPDQASTLLDKSDRGRASDCG